MIKNLELQTIYHYKACSYPK